MTGAESIAASGTFVRLRTRDHGIRPRLPAPALALFVMSRLDAPPDAARIVNVLATAILVLAASLLGPGDRSFQEALLPSSRWRQMPHKFTCATVLPSGRRPSSPPYSFFSCSR